ncbi:MAG TPA: response regulator transcription factor [Polyangiaceae bacterium]|nr:response regulator transcription factor [Polyangiaceae bacterium]
MSAARAAAVASSSAPSKPTLLVVEDDPRMLEILRSLLAEHGYHVASATTGEEAIANAFSVQPALVLLDLGLPDIDGVRVATHIRECSRVPILVLSARSSERDIVDALDGGANDFITKPFRERELFARVRGLLRTFAWIDDTERSFGDFQIDPRLRRVLVKGRDVRLSATEFKLFSVLLRASGAVVMHQQMLLEIWGPGHADQVQYLRVYMRYLREKLETTPAKPLYLLTEPGIGYRLRTTATEADAD